MTGQEYLQRADDLHIREQLLSSKIQARIAAGIGSDNSDLCALIQSHRSILDEFGALDRVFARKG